MIGKIELRGWNKLSYIDPCKYLSGLDSLHKVFDLSELPREIEELRTRELEHHRETREAAIFCYGLGQCVLGNDVDFSMHEVSDYDFVTRTIYDDSVVYVPVQTKELPPNTIGSKSIESELEKLAKYGDSNDLVIAYHLNRCLNINIKNIKIPKLNIAAIYFFGMLPKPGNPWFISGGKLGEFGYGEFELPQA